MSFNMIITWHSVVQYQDRSYLNLFFFFVFMTITIFFYWVLKQYHLNQRFTERSHVAYILGIKILRPARGSFVQFRTGKEHDGVKTNYSNDCMTDHTRKSSIRFCKFGSQSLPELKQFKFRSLSWSKLWLFHGSFTERLQKGPQTKKERDTENRDSRLK